MKSRELYVDCCSARDLLVKAIQEKKTAEAKVAWFASLAMLRAIGHVLEKVDSPGGGTAFKELLKEKYDHWKEVEIFRDFIELERNAIIKEYRSSLTVKEQCKVVKLVTVDHRTLKSKDGFSLHSTESITEFIKGSGLGSEKSPLTTLNRALEWWDTQLKELENNIS